ncbi:MAG: TIGR02556 family CRISPR-associated protein [Caldisericaceae bacterium]
MLEAVKKIGELSLKERKESFAFSLIEEGIDFGSEENKKYILTLNFDLQEEKIHLDFEEIDYKKLQKYLWIGNAKSNNPQDRLTTNNVSYLLYQTIPNLYHNLKEGDLKDKLQSILEKFFLKLGQKSVYLLNLEKIEGSNIKVEEILQNFPHDFKKVKDFVEKIYEKEFYEILKNKDLSNNDFSLYSVKIDGLAPSELQEYIDYIEEKLIGEPFEDSSFEGTCYVCGKKTLITADTTKLPDKYYITKLVTFASGLDKKGFSKNFAICKDCYKELMAGSSYIRNNLSQRLAGRDLYLIPSIMFSPKEDYTLKDIVGVSKSSFNAIKSFEGKLEFQNTIEKNLVNYTKYKEIGSYSNINLLFFEKNQSAFKIKKLIKDIPLRRLDEIRKAQNDTQNITKKLFGESASRWFFISLDQIYYLIPVRIDKKSKRAVDYKKMLDLYEDLFVGRKINKNFLINEFLELFQVYRFEKFAQFNILKPKDSDIEMVFAILKTNFLLKMFSLLHILNGGEKMIEGVDDLPLREEIKNYWKEMNFSEQEAALFLLGYLIGEVGNKQRTGESNKKPILEKINYQGMNLKRIILLSNEIFEKLDQYKVRDFNEVNFAIMKRFMDKNISNWSISDSENVYWILSGYAFNTYKVITSKKEEKNEQ